MKVRSKSSSSTQILIGFSVLLMFIAQTSVLWALGRVIRTRPHLGLTLEYPLTRQQFNQGFLAE